MRRIRRAYGFSVLAMAAISFGGCGESPSKARDALASDAIGGSSVSTQVEATRQLAGEGREAIEPLRRVFQESDETKVRVEAAKALGDALDVDSFPALLDALDSESVEIRRAADEAIEKIAGRDYYFEADAPPDERAKAVARIRQFWENVKQPGSNFVEFRRHPEKLEEAKRKASRRYGAR